MRYWTFLMGAVFLLVLSGCGGGHSGDHSGSGGMTISGTVPPDVATGTATSPIAGAQTITVTLSEYSVQLDRTTIPAGPVRLVVINKGQRGHQFQVYPQSSAPTGSGQGHNMNMAQGGVLPGATGFLALVPVGTTRALDVTFPTKAGTWELACHLQDSENGKQFDHYDRGMKTPLTVTP